MTRLSISEARTQLTRLARKPGHSHEAVEVTSRGMPVLAILPWELYEAMEETIEIMSDETLMKKLRLSIADSKKGKLIPLADVKKSLKLI